MTTRVVSNMIMITCIHPGCTQPATEAFASHPDDVRCVEHHKREMQRRIAAVEAATGMFKALVG